MVAPVKPTKIKMTGRQTFWLVPAIADISAPTVAEINAVSGINLSCTLLATSTALTPTFNKVAFDRYLCETDTTEANDTTSWSMADLIGGFDPQAAALSDDKAGFEFLRDPFVGFAVFRNGKPADVVSPAAVAAEFVNVAAVDITAAVDISSPAEASAWARWTAGVSVTGTPAMNVAVAA